MNECTECYAPLKENECGKCNRCKSDAGWVDERGAYNIDTDCFDLRKVKITCPFCDREFAPLLSRFTKTIRCFSTDVCGECPAAEMESFCRVCRNKITFKIHCD